MYQLPANDDLRRLEVYLGMQIVMIGLHVGKKEGFVGFRLTSPASSHL